MWLKAKWLLLGLILGAAAFYFTGVWFELFSWNFSLSSEDKLLGGSCTYEKVPGTLGLREGKLWCFTTFPPAGK